MSISDLIKNKFVEEFTAISVGTLLTTLLLSFALGLFVLVIYRVTYGGVSFSKGCYPGQEIVARTQYLGKVKRHLYRLHAETAMVPGLPIHSPDSPEHPVGMVANAAPAPTGGYVALAVIQENYLDSALTLGTPEGIRFRVEHLA